MNRRHVEESYQNDDHSRFAGPTFLNKGPRNYRRSDARIYEDVCEALLNDPKVDASNIVVEVSAGLVTLRGTVETRSMKREAERCIEYIPGVGDVMNLVKIQQFIQAGAEGLVKKQGRVEE